MVNYQWCITKGVLMEINGVLLRGINNNGYYQWCIMNGVLLFPLSGSYVGKTHNIANGYY